MPLSSLILLIALSPGAPAVEHDYDLTFAEREGRALKLDLARPAEGDGPFPAVVVIHGGAWRAGDKSAHRDLLDRFAERGYVAISPAYRFCPDFTFPAQVHDVKAAVRWLKGHADDYHVDPDRVGAMGFSAGGHLALMLGLTDGDDGLEGEAAEGSPDTRVAAVVNYFGPTDLLADDIPAVSKPLLRDFLGGRPAEKEAEAKAGSPLLPMASRTTRALLSSVAAVSSLSSEAWTYVLSSSSSPLRRDMLPRPSKLTFATMSSRSFCARERSSSAVPRVGSPISDRADAARARSTARKPLPTSTSERASREASVPDSSSPKNSAGRAASSMAPAFRAATRRWAASGCAFNHAASSRAAA